MWLFLLYSKVIHLCIYIYLCFFRFFSHRDYQRILDRVPCAIQQVSIDSQSIYYSVHMPMPNPESPPHLSALLTIRLFSMSASLFMFCKLVHVYPPPFFFDSTYKLYCTVFIVWLTSLSMKISRSIHVSMNSNISLFLWFSNIPLYILLHLLYPFLYQWTFSLLPCLGLVKSATMHNWGEYIFLNYSCV